MSILRRAVATLATPERRMWTPSWLEQLTGQRMGWDSWSGVSVTDATALAQTTVWSCVDLISGTMAQLPVGSFRGEGPARVPIAPDPLILREPGEPGMTMDEWLGQAGVSILLRGNTYGEVLSRDRLAYPTQVMLHHPDEVAVRRSDGRVLYKFPGRDWTERYPVGDAWHVKGLTLPGAFRSLEGLSPVTYARQTIGTAIAAEEFGSRFFGDGAQPSGLLTTEADIEEDELTRMAERFNDAYGNRQRKTAALAGGLSWEKISLTAEESQFLATISAKREEICGFFRVPPHMIGMVERSTSWGTGIEEQMLGFVTFTLGPWIRRFEAALSYLLPPPQYVKFNFAGLLRGRLTERYRAYLMGRQGGWLSIDDVRALEEMAPLPDGKGADYLTPLNYGPIPPGGLVDDGTDEPPPDNPPPPTPLAP